MMLKMIIADDEEIILDGLKESIDWAAYGITVAATAHNGAEAVEKALMHKPDIIVSDIKMPVLNGLELVREIRKTRTDIKFIFISAYEQFEYAQEAISLGVLSYITKPLKKQKIIDEVVKARDLILEERLDKEKSSRLEELYLTNLPIISEHYHNNLIMGKTQIAVDYKKQFLTYGIDLDDDNAGVLVFRIEDMEESTRELFEKSVQIIHLRIAEMIREQLPGQYKKTVFQSYNNEIVVIYNAGSDQLSAIREAALAAEAVKNKLRREAAISISAGIGRIYPSLKDAAQSYREAVKALDYRLVYGNNTVLYIDNVELKEMKQTNIFGNLNEVLANIQNILWTGKAEEVFKLIDKEISGLFGYKDLPYHYLQQIYCHLLSALLRTIYEMNILPEELYGTPVVLYSELFRKQSLDEMAKWYRELVHKACGAINAKKGQKTNNVIRTCTDYIKKNCNKDISLGEVAERVNLNPSYFSRLFKDETGMQFIEYVRNVRMEAAKDLLRNSGKKIYEICEELGYQNVQYFTTIFKNTVGMTPAEYKKSGKY